MKNKISPKQIAFSTCCIILATSLLSKHLYIYTGQEAWVSVILGFTISLLAIWMYSALANRFPGDSLIEINDKVFGLILGKFFSGLYIYFFFTLACLNTSTIGRFGKSLVLPNTPQLFIHILFLLVCAWAVRKGPVNFVKYSTLFAVSSIAAILFNTALLYNRVDFRNLLPMFSHTAADYAVGTHFIAIIPLCEPFVFLMFLPYLQKPKELGKSLAAGTTLGAGMLLLIILRDIVVLGQTGTLLFTYPSFMVLRFIDVGDILTRMEIIYAFILISLMFFKVIVFYYAAVSGFGRLMKFNTHEFLILIFGALIAIYSFTMMDANEHFEWLVSGAAAIHSTVFLVVLPVITLIAATARGFFKKAAIQVT